MNNILGMRLKNRRLSLKLTQGELGEKVGVRKEAISKWESGTRQPNPQTLKQLSDILECTTDYLMGKAQNPNGVCYSRNDNELGLVTLEYPSQYRITQKEFELFIKELKEIGCDVDALLNKVKQESAKNK